MTTRDDDRLLLLRLLEQDLDDDEAHGLQERLRREPALRARLERLRAMQHALSASRPDAFAPYFSERVLRRLTPASEDRPAEAFYDSLLWLFNRVATAGLVLAGALGTYNVIDFQQLGVASSILEAVLGLPSASLIDALAYGAW